MNIKTIDIANVSGGKYAGHAAISARYDRTRNGFKHTAEIRLPGFETVEYRACYVNRTWEEYPFQSVLHGAVRELVDNFTGIDVWKMEGKRDAVPCKGAEAEARRLARVEARGQAKEFYHRLCAIVDGRETEADFAGKPLAAAA